MEFSKVSQTGKNILMLPAISNGLKVIVRRCYLAVRSLRLHDKAGVAKVRGDVESVVSPAMTGTRRDRWLDFNFLLVGISLSFMVHVPTERNKHLIDVVFANLGFLIFGRE